MKSWEYRVEHMPPTHMERFLGCGKNATTWELLAVCPMNSKVVMLIFKRPYELPSDYVVKADDKICERANEPPVICPWLEFGESGMLDGD